MSRMFWIALVLFAVIDVVVIAVMIRRFGAGLLGGAAPGGKVLETAHAMVGDYLRANYSGDPAQLPSALAGLMPRLRDLLRDQGVEPKPEVLRALVEISAARHRIASPQELREALANLG